MSADPVLPAGAIERVEHHACFGGVQEVWRHTATSLACSMRLGVYLPPAALRGEACPVLYWLSGLTCTEQNFITKAGAQQFAAQHQLILVAPDTSPRGEGVANDDAYDLGQGAGFYLNATQAPWAPHFRMEDYVVHELPALIEQHFPATDARGIFGHSMGGHGALTLALRHPEQFVSVSAIAPICAPMDCPWGQKAFAAYLGDDQTRWAAHDASRLIRQLGAKNHRPFAQMLVDQGEADGFLGDGSAEKPHQLQPDALEAACAAVGQPLTLRRHAGYDHGYYFIQSVIGDHLAFHAAAPAAPVQV